jgi:molecular chaperone GrpE
MTDETAGGPAGVANEPEAMGQPAQVEAPAPAGPDLESLTKEVAEYRDRWMRAIAEMENLRRRTEREVADARTYGVTSFARDLLAVADNMHRALSTLTPEVREATDAVVRSMIDGVELTERELAKVLEKYGVKKLSPKDQKFDPNFHQAMFEVPDTSVPSGTVVQVVQEGYTIGERVLRPALVGVAKGGPKPAPAANDNPADASPAEPVTGK